MAWIEGLSSSNRLLQDLAKIFTQANKDTSGNVDEAKNWQIVHPRPFDMNAVSGGPLTVDGVDPQKFSTGKTNLTPFIDVVVYVTDASAVTTIVDAASYTVDHEAGTITFSGTVPTGTLTADFDYKTNESLQTAFDKIGPYGRMVLKTTTTTVTPDTSSDPFNTDPDLKADKLTMFVEIEKPQFLLNPETGQLATKYGDNATLENHYHLNMRMFDRYDEFSEQPVAKVIDPASGLVIDEGAHVSEWSKFSWYSDFKEFLIDELDSDPGTDNINDGIVFTYLETAGLYGEVPIQYWISTNNDRIAMVLMGEPSINYDNYLSSFAYVGKIDSFEGSKNDTAGNFALTTGSSTIPCVAKPNNDPITEKPIFGATPIAATTGSGSYNFQQRVSYKVVAVNDDGFGPTSDPMETYYTDKNNSSSAATYAAPVDYTNFKLTFTNIPSNATKIRIYRKDVSVAPAVQNDANWFLESEVYVTALSTDASGNKTYTGVNAQDNTKPVPVSNYNPDEAGVVRDPITGGVIEVKFPKTWGTNTATGVNDVSMYKTRSGVYFQRHQASFITPEEFMKKDAFNPSRWTNKFHLSPLYLVHGYDGYRGWLKDIVVVDDSSIVHLDELIVGKGTAQEEIYKYFRLSAPFSLMTNSANTNYGIGIKKV
jgi:hypothetical protein